MITHAEALALARLAYLTPTASKAAITQARDMLYAQYTFLEVVGLWMDAKRGNIVKV